METSYAPPQTPTITRPPVRQTTIASRGSRLLAAIIDTAVFLGVYLVTFLVREPFVFIVGLAAVAIYQIYLLSTYGQSIGKRVMNIKIVKVDTDQNGGFVPNVLLRGFVNGILSFVPLYSLVDILFIFRQDQRCIHDMIAGTKVVDA